MTGMDTRIGYPNEHLGTHVPDEITSPMYATGVGLVLIGLTRSLKEKNKQEFVDPKRSKQVSRKDRSSFFDKIKAWFDEEGVE